jgi:DNA-binding MurR/RpiR family transcriptional regulator
VSNQRLRTLIRQQPDENLTPEEQQELIQLTQQVELLNVDRITHLASLAKIRQTTIPKLIEELGLRPIEYD